MAEDATENLDTSPDALPVVEDVPEGSEASEAPSDVTPAQRLQRQTCTQKKRWGIGRVIVSGLGTLVTFLLFLAVVALLSIMGRSVELPQWAVDRIEERVNRDLAGEVVQLESVAIGLRDESYRPTVDLGGLLVENADGQRLLELPHLRSKLDTSELLLGRIKVETLELTGAALELARDRNGQIALAFGASVGGGGMQVGSVKQVMEQVDIWLASPLFVGLEEVKAQALSIRLADARSGGVATVEQGRLRLTNTQRVVTLRLSFDLEQPGGPPANLLFAADKAKGVQGARVVGKFTDLDVRGLANQVAALNFLNVLDAPVSGALTAEIDTEGQVAGLAGTLDIGQGVLQPTPEAKPVPFNSAKTYVRYEAANGRLVFDQIKLDAPELRLDATGHADLTDFDAGIPQTLLGQLRFSNIRLAPEGMFEAPVSFTSGALDLRYKPSALELDIGQLVLRNTGVDLLAKGSVSVLPGGWSVSLDAGIGTIRHDRLLALWPEGAVPKTREWLLTNILEGDAQNVAAAIRVRPDNGIKAAVSFDFSDAKVRYLKTLPPVEGATGFASISGDAFHLSLSEGRIAAPQGGELEAGGSRMTIPKMNGKPAMGEFDLTLNGPLTAALQVLDLKPFEFLSKSDLSPSVATGQANIEATLSVPLISKVKLVDVEYAVAAEVKAVRSDSLIEGRSLRSDKMVVAAGDGALSIEGAGIIDDIPIDVVWSRKIGKGTGNTSKVTGTIELSNRTLDAFNVGLPKGSVSGRGLGQIKIALNKGQVPDMVLRSNLKGVGLSIPALGWSKPSAASGNLEIGMLLGPDPKVKGLSLKTAGLEAKGDVQLRPGGGLDRAIFEPLKVAGRLNSRVDIIGRGKAPAQIKITGGTIDIRKFGVTGGGGGSGAPIELALDRLVVTDTISLDQFRGSFRTTKGLDGTFKANLNGEAPVSGTVVPTAKGAAVRIQSDNGGRVIRASGIFRNANGGDMSLTLQPNGKPGQFDGQLKITNARVKKAPALADLLSAISVIGLLEQLTGDGILFGNVDARFLLAPGGVTLRSSSAVGPSMGITMDGIYNTTTRRMDMRGVVSPIYAVNGIFGAIFSPRRGEGLFGFNYTLKGSADAPQVGVNPLSILTPGIFREIFRQPPPKLRN